MASVQQTAPDHWEVELGAGSEVTIEVHMSREQAEQLVALETDRIARLNPGRTDLPPANPGIAALFVLSLFIAGSERGQVKASG